jgi:hypothetical protein
VPTVQESNGRYAVAIAPGVRICWWFTVDPDKKLRCSVKIDVPYELVDIDERTDIISFPVQMMSTVGLIVTLSALALAALLVAVLSLPPRHKRRNPPKLGEIHLATRRVFTFILIIYNVVAFEH